MKVESPSKNLITTLPSTASQTTTSARWVVRSLPSTLPSKRRSVASSSSVARWIRASPLPFSSPIDRSATRGSRDAQDALGEDRAHPRVLDEVLGSRVGVGADVEEDHRALRGDHLDRERRAIDAGQPAEPQDRGGHPGAGVTRGHDRVRLAVLDQVDRDEDRRVLLLAEGQRRMLVHPDDLAGMDDRDVGRELAGDARGPSPRHRPGSPGRPGSRGRGRAPRERPRTDRDRRPSRRPRRGPRRPRCGRAGAWARSPRQRAASSAGVRCLGGTARRPW